MKSRVVLIIEPGLASDSDQTCANIKMYMPSVTTQRIKHLVFAMIISLCYSFFTLKHGIIGTSKFLPSGADAVQTRVFALAIAFGWSSGSKQQLNHAFHSANALGTYPCVIISLGRLSS
jgi:hypothetical protein